MIGIFIFLFAIVPSSQAIENSDCLDCHGEQDMVKELPNGKTLSLYVNAEKFAASVHNQNDIACTDCHSSITELNEEEDVPHMVPVPPVVCADCHDEEEEDYEKSVHYRIRSQGNSKAPTCKNCHNYHYTKYLDANTVIQGEQEACLKCHNPNKFHKWLPAKGFHFRYVQCLACHDSEAHHRLSLRLYDATTEKYLSGKEVLDKLGTSGDQFMKEFDLNGNGTLDINEFSSFNKKLKKAKIRGVFKGELTVDLDPSDHNITRKKALKDCNACHNRKSAILKKVVLVITDPATGKASIYPINKEVLPSIRMPHFYILNSTRVTWLDIIGVLIVLGGIGFALGHLTLRILTAPLRRRREEQ